MSPNGTTGPPQQSSRNSGNKFRLAMQTRNAAKLRCAPTKSVRDIRCETNSEILSSSSDGRLFGRNKNGPKIWGCAPMGGQLDLI